MANGQEVEVEDLHPVVSGTDLMEIERDRKVDWKKVLSDLEIQKESFKKLRVLLLGYTRPRDWVIIDGEPYLQESGCQSVAGPMGVSISEPTFIKEWMEDNQGRYYMYTCTAQASSPRINRSLGAVGICTSRDKFFGFAGGEWKELEEIDEKNIKMKSYTNLQANGIKRLLGLRNVEISELVRAGIDVDALKKVDHKIGGRKTDASSKAIDEGKKQAATTPEYTPDQVKIAQDLTNNILQANSMEALARTWEADQGKRRALPEDLINQIITEKNRKKDWLLKQLAEKKDAL